MRTRRTLLAVGAALALPADGKAAAPLTLGQGQAPGVAVGAGGVTYAAWQGRNPQGDSPLVFCRVPAGATACAGGPRVLAAPGTSGSNPWVVERGNRVLVAQQRYGAAVPNFSGVFLLTSKDRGLTFGPPVYVGMANMASAVWGPGETLSTIGEKSTETPFENIQLGAAKDEPGYANLQAGGHVFGIVGLDGSAPLAVLSDGGGDAQWRRFRGTGSPNDAANWTAPAPLGDLGNAPKLAGGKLGLHVIGHDTKGRVFVRRFTGKSWNPPAIVANGSDGPWLEQQDLTFPPRLHALYVRSDGSGQHLLHAISDDGVRWRESTLVSATRLEDAGFDNRRMAVGAGDAGAAVWRAANYDIRLARFDSPGAVPPGTPTAGALKAFSFAGAKATVKAPPTCVRPRRTVAVSLAVAPPRGRGPATLERVKDVAFAVDGKRRAIDRRSPFRARLATRAQRPGSKHRVAVRVRGVTRSGRAVARTATVAYRVCTT